MGTVIARESAKKPRRAEVWEVMDGLYRHHADAAANQLALGHIAAMKRTYGFVIYPEAWDAEGLPWGDQWYASFLGF